MLTKTKVHKPKFFCISDNWLTALAQYDVQSSVTTWLTSNQFREQTKEPIRISSHPHGSENLHMHCYSKGALL